MAIFNQLLNSMRYKSFEWPNNPSQCKFTCDRSYAKHKYPELSGTELEDMDPNAAIITGNGEFFGEDAYMYWQDLVAVFNEHGPGAFYHPVFGDISDVLMTSLEATLEPREDYIAYSFEFVENTPNMPAVITVAQSTGPAAAASSGGGSGGRIKVGDVVICNGTAYYTSGGTINIDNSGNDVAKYNPFTGVGSSSGGGTSPSPTATLNNKKMTVTIVNYGSTYPIHVGSTGWMSESSVKLESGSGEAGSGSQQKYTIKAGDTLSAIGRKYNVDWQMIASANNIKDPNNVPIGTTLIIP